MVVGIIAEAMTNGNINTSTGAINSVDDINDGLTASRNKHLLHDFLKDLLTPSELS